MDTLPSVTVMCRCYMFGMCVEMCCIQCLVVMLEFIKYVCICVWQQISDNNQCSSSAVRLKKSATKDCFTPNSVFTTAGEPHVEEARCQSLK